MKKLIFLLTIILLFSFQEVEKRRTDTLHDAKAIAAEISVITMQLNVYTVYFFNEKEEADGYIDSLGELNFMDCSNDGWKRGNYQPSAGEPAVLIWVRCD